eukprot:m.134884 g.134884  ORF g.134884 m.134884 type:complete len:92 (+) comp9765_c0_seq1:428-703(+)
MVLSVLTFKLAVRLLLDMAAVLYKMRCVAMMESIVANMEPPAAFPVVTRYLSTRPLGEISAHTMFACSMCIIFLWHPICNKFNTYRHCTFV